MANDENVNGYEPSSPEERARKQARVRGMTDPLGSMGFRDTPKRYRREGRARRGVFGGAAASFVIGTALIIAANERGAESAPSTETVSPTSQVVTGQDAGQPQSVTTSPAQPGDTVNVTAPATEAPANGLNGGESDEVLVKSRPALVTAGDRDEDDRYEDDDDRYEDEDDDDDDDWDDEDDDDDDYEYASSSGAQITTAPSTTSGTSSQTEIVITQPKPHTQTSSTRD